MRYIEQCLGDLQHKCFKQKPPNGHVFMSKRIDRTNWQVGQISPGISNMPRKNYNAGLTLLEYWSILFLKVPKWVLGSVLYNLQLNKSLTHSNFPYFTFSGENIKIRPRWKNLTLPEKKFNFHLEPRFFQGVLVGSRGCVTDGFSSKFWGKHD